MAGGPGSAGTADLQGPRGPMFERLRSVADVIIPDQRGTGRSNAIPICEPDARLDPMMLTGPAIAGYFRQQFGRCLDQWRAAGVDPAGYTLMDSAEDLEALRLALGARRIDLVAISYGPQLASAYMKAHPSHVGRAVLASGRGLDQTVRLPADVDAYLRRMGGAELVDTMRRVHARLDANPVTVELTPQGSRDPVTIRFDSFPVRYAVSFFLINDASGARSLTDLYRRMDQGDFAAIAQLIQSRCLDPRAGRFTAFRGMGEIMDLSSNWSAARKALWQSQVAQSALGDAHNYPVPQGLGDWPDLDIDPAWRQPLKTSIPTLFLTGTADGRLPMESQAATMRGFSRGRQIVIDGGGHNLFEQSVDIQEATRLFLASGRVVQPRIVLPSA
ncbi:MAG: alpha/beta fold hydrolase [Acidobacteriota bacterium]